MSFQELLKNYIYSYNLAHCEKCAQMTNHLGSMCQKCKSMTIEEINNSFVNFINKGEYCGSMGDNIQPNKTPEVKTWEEIFRKQYQKYFVGVSIGTFENIISFMNGVAEESKAEGRRECKLEYGIIDKN